MNLIIQKNFISRLFESRKRKKYSTLGPKAINHLTKCFTYAVKGNSDRESLEKNLRAIPFHVTGECFQMWKLVRVRK